MRTDDAKRIDDAFRISLNDFGAHISSLRHGVSCDVNERVALWDIREKLTTLFEELLDRHEGLLIDFGTANISLDSKLQKCKRLWDECCLLSEENESLRKKLTVLSDDSANAENIVLRKENKTLRRKNKALDDCYSELRKIKEENASIMEKYSELCSYLVKDQRFIVEVCVDWLVNHRVFTPCEERPDATVFDASNDVNFMVMAVSDSFPNVSSSQLTQCALIAVSAWKMCTACSKNDSTPTQKEAENE